MSTKDDDTDERVLMGPMMPDGYRAICRQDDEGNLVGGLARVVKDGEPLSENAFFAEHEQGPVYRIKSVFSANVKTKPATKEYRQGWDRIFGGSRTVAQA